MVKYYSVVSSEHQSIYEKHLQFARERGSEKTYCPSEVARVLFPDGWRDKMYEVRAVADELCDKGILIVSQNSKDLNILPSKAKGPIRLRKGPNFKVRKEYSSKHMI